MKMHHLHNWEFIDERLAICYCNDEMTVYGEIINNNHIEEVAWMYKPKRKNIMWSYCFKDGGIDETNTS